MLGKTISHYLVLEKLGGGGMGVVYKARDTVLGRLVALKVVSPDFLKDQAAVSGFIREAKAASALNHPNILTVHDLVEAEGAHCLVMELVEGQTLRQCIGQKGMETKQLLKAAIQVAEALAAAHKAGIVHRDLKPENIMVRNDGHVKVVDFGLAKLLGLGKPDRTSAASLEATVPLDEAIHARREGDAEKSHVTGTIPYMSPEQLSGGTVDQRSDIFSFGIVLYEMATGQQPFQGTTTRGIVEQILDKDPKPVTILSPVAPEKLQEIVSKCLEKDPADRYQHVDDIVVDLRKIKRVTESGSRIPISHRTVPYGTPAPRRPRRLVLYSAVAAAVFLAVGLVFLARRFVLKPEVDIVLKWGEEIGNACISPDGTTIAFDSGVSGQREIYVMLAKGGSPRQVTQGPGEKSDPRFSRDGTQLLYSVQGASSGIWTVSTLGVNPQKLISDANSADWSSDGKRIAYARKVTGEPASLLICDSSGYNEHSIYTSRFEKISEVRWSPDDKWIFFNASEGPSVIAPSGGPVKKLEKLPEEADDVVWAPRGQYIFYSSRVNGITNIWRLKVPDGQPERVTKGPGDDFDPMPLPEGHLFVYAHGRKERDLWLAPGNGKEARKLVRGGWVSNPAISSDGKKIAYVGEEADGSQYVWATGIDGQSPAKLTRVGSYSNLVWSAKGDRLAFTALVKEPAEYNHVFIMDLGDKKTTQVTQGLFDAYADDLRPEGNAALYEKVIEMKSVLMSVEPSTGKELQLGNDLEGGRYSSDGRWLLALGATDKPERRGLWILPAQGGGETRIVTEAVAYARWAHHDHAIIFSSPGKTKGKVSLWKLLIQDGKVIGTPSLFFSFPASPNAESEWDVSDDLSWVVFPQNDNRADFYKILSAE